MESVRLSFHESVKNENLDSSNERNSADSTIQVIFGNLRKSLKWPAKKTAEPTATRVENHEDPADTMEAENPQYCINIFDGFTIQLCGHFDGMMENEMVECRSQFLEQIERNRTISKNIEAIKVEVWDSDEGEKGMFMFESVLVQTEAEHQAPVVLVRHFKNKQDAMASAVKDKEPLPAILVIPSNDSSIDSLISNKTLHRLAQLGFVAVGMDCRFQGKRLPKEKTGEAQDIYMKELITAYDESNGLHHPFLYDNIWDLMRVIDYLQTRDDVDPAAIGTTGESIGGIHALFLAFADERIKAVVPVNGVYSFTWALEHNSWKPLAKRLWPVFEAGAKWQGKDEVDVDVARQVWSTLCPDLLYRFDAPRILSAIAPRSVLVIHGGMNLEFPVKGVRKAHQTASASFSELSTESEIEIYIEKGANLSVSETMWNKLEFFFVHKLKAKTNVP